VVKHQHTTKDSALGRSKLKRALLNDSEPSSSEAIFMPTSLKSLAFRLWPKIGLRVIDGSDPACDICGDTGDDGTEHGGDSVLATLSSNLDHHNFALENSNNLRKNPFFCSGGLDRAKLVRPSLSLGFCIMMTRSETHNDNF